jgi:hypothetical protein
MFRGAGAAVVGAAIACTDMGDPAIGSGFAPCRRSDPAHDPPRHRPLGSRYGRGGPSRPQPPVCAGSSRPHLHYRKGKKDVRGRKRIPAL